MRTTVNIGEHLLEFARELAPARGMTLGDLLEASLQHYLSLPGREEGPPLRVFRGGTGFAPGIDPLSNASIYEATPADDPGHA